MQNIEDFYPLSPMQQGILFHTLAAPNSGVYFIQFSCTIHDNLNTAIFQSAWEKVTQRHQLLRTSFLWEGIKEPVQVVHQQINLPWQQQDWRMLSTIEQQERFKALLKADQKQGFSLAQVPMMRLTLIQLAENSYQFLWSGHHLMMDGWSSAVLLEEVFAYYIALKQGETLQLEKPRPYRDYVAWLQQQDFSQSEQFWQEWLRSFTTVTCLNSNQKPNNSLKQNHNYEQQLLELPQTTTTALQSFARQQQLTLNTLVQGAWALLLNLDSGENDVVFGVVFAGRPITLSGVAAMVGPFVNTLPMRVQIEAEELLIPWLKKLQAKQTQMQQHEHTPLVKIQRWSDMPLGQPLFESVLNFQNYSQHLTAPERGDGNIKLDECRSFGKMNYPFYIDALPGQQLSMYFVYDTDYFEAATVARVVKHFEIILYNLLLQPQATLNELLDKIPEIDQQQRNKAKQQQKEQHNQKLKNIKRKVIYALPETE
ncbi:condensation domain-containing protein [Nostoc sp. FACHB-110]|uniref:condensation domain-containing protein n=1 Tax=Nostoc sp. FACHB-110 TaxID=2692834 RepID=UPI0016855636|nr:condensation domain-containing protein [Nostoc sp. FACHB-110]MBD2435876.1 hypothetical protein [Nostoc sp. FACHB-110]